MSEVVAQRMSRSTRGLNESYIALLLLTWNDIVTNGGKQSVAQLEQTMKVRAVEWIHELYVNYSYIPLKDTTRESLKSLIDQDSGVHMVRKAKEAIHVVVNVLNPAWKDPVAFASGTQLVDALEVCKQAAWERNEEDKQKVKAAKNVEYAMKPFDANWKVKEWLAFRYLGLPAGR